MSAAHTYANFKQPSKPGLTANLDLIGDPLLCADDVIQIVGYGNYIVLPFPKAVSDSPFINRYSVQLTSHTSAIINVPIGTPVTVDGEGQLHADLPYPPSGVIALNFKGADYQTLRLTGNISFNAQQHKCLKTLVIIIRNNASPHNMSFPPSWAWMGAAGRPSSIAANKTGVLSLTCVGTSDADVIAVWTVQG